MDDQANKLSLESAKWTAEKLRELNNGDQLALINAHRRRDQATFNKILFENLITNPDGIWQGLDDLNIQNSQGANIKIESGKPEKEIPQRQSSTLNLASMGTGIGLSILSRNANYNNFKKNSDKYAQQKVQQWKADQARKAKLLSQTQQSSTQQSPQLIPRPVTRLGVLAQGAKKLPQGDSNWGTLEAGTNRAGIEEISPSWTRARTEEEAYQLALLEQYDRLAEISPASAQEWAKKYNDPQIQQAIDRKKALDEKLRKEWNSVFTQEQLSDPRIRAQIETGIKQRRRPGTQTSKGLTRQTTQTVYSNASLEKDNPNQIATIKKRLEQTNLTQKDLDEIFLTHSGRITEAEKLLKRPLSPIERLALLRAHYEGFEETGKTGGPAGVYNYTQRQIAQKTELLKSAGLDKTQRRQIIESGLAGHNLSSSNKPSPWTDFNLYKTAKSEMHRDTNKPKRDNQSLIDSLSKREIKRSALNRVKNKVSNTKIGKKFSASKFGQKFKRLGRGIGRARNILNPIAYLEKLILRSAIGSLGGAIGGLISTAVGALVSAITTITTAIVGAISIILSNVIEGIIGAVLAVNFIWVLIIAVVIFLIILIFSIFFSPEKPGDQIKNSPFPGINYSIVCSNCVLDSEGKYRISNGKNIEYKILFLYNPDKSSSQIENITLVSDVPLGTKVIPTRTTGKYTLSNGKISWKLSENNPISENGNGILGYSFDFVLDPDDNITIEIRLSLLGVASGEKPPPATGDDCNGKYNSNNSERGNFGDPDCDWTKNKAAEYMKQLDSENSYFWYLIAECESSHWPNAYYANAVERTGAWGMYQMSINTDTGYPFTAGRVPWRDQTEVAFNRETKVAETKQYNNPFDYWQCEDNACQDAPRLCTNGEYNVRGRTW